MPNSLQTAIFEVGLKLTYEDLKRVARSDPVVALVSLEPGWYAAALRLCTDSEQASGMQTERIGRAAFEDVPGPADRNRQRSEAHGPHWTT